MAGAPDSLKYQAVGRFDQLEVCVIGCGLSTEKLSSDIRPRDGAASLNDLNGIIKDAAHVYEYFRENGAKIHTMSFRLPPEPGAVVKKYICNFLTRPGNAKLFYYSGHGRKADGALVLGDDEYFTPRDMVWQLRRAGFNGVITVVIDACFSGQWSVHLWRILNEKPRWGLGTCLPSPDAPGAPLARIAERTGLNTFINLRLAALAFEDANDTPAGGAYTNAWIAQLRRERAWTDKSGVGWGTKVWTERPPQENECIWGTGRAEPQTDIAVDILYDAATRSWMRFYPPSREGLVDLEAPTEQ